jgi:hypothetical protein
MKKVMIVLGVVLSMSSCMINTHTVGEGSKGQEKVSKEMFYLIGNRISKVDTKELAGDAESYTIKTEMGPIGFILNTLTFGVISTRTVTVTK